MLKLIRYTLTTFFFIGLLSFTYNGKPLFHYAYKYSKVIVTPAQESTQNFLRVSYHRTLDFSRQFFNNNVPAVDTLDYQLSAPSRDDSDYVEEQKKLDDIFGN